jgi:hypothetical protein
MRIVLTKAQVKKIIGDYVKESVGVSVSDVLFYEKDKYQDISGVDVFFNTKKEETK